ncbi:chromosome segregation protein SMC [Halomicronema hongdechloris C2206]|uniref:Chromosome partition protein Smc n=1 Tax=Halomicronema hongdechloris C2206 TaxID=1641165 RepID=A0A1Z3HUP2_9CYAN|nr:chromosome segregation protein SMC [Halomicronema hongdechloris]ASC73847.1 chromosome segregation protein SMC [Halomicronema hongdechloris C2206]
MHIKSVELSHFKSFGGTTQVPFLPGFTVISGPNGSGKSNILDALLFCLGLASSKGMRAERLPDLVNQNQASRRSTAEASVTVVFDISDLPPELLVEDDEAETETTAGGDVNGDGDAVANVVPLVREWSVTRRLRVTTQGTYTSNYYINGEPCTLGQLHEQLQRFRIYPEGYNVVLQGDVTSIISMNSRERREIIDELAGVAAFDRKIDQARGKLDAVKDQEERFRIVERELISQRDRLDQDRRKAEKYQQLRETLQTKTQWEAVLIWQAQQRLCQELTQQIQAGEAEARQLDQTIVETTAAIEALATELDELNRRVKALGEEEHLALQSQLATQEAELRQLQRQEQALQAAAQQTAAAQRQTQITLQEQRQTLADLQQALTPLAAQELPRLRQDCDQAQQTLDQRRQAASEMADASQTWVQEQTQLRHRIEALLATLEPQRSEQVRLQERLHQLQQQVQGQQQVLQELEKEWLAAAGPEASVEATLETEVQTLAATLAQTEQELQVQQETQARLLREQREKQRALDRLEAQVQALQESQGTRATEVLLKSGLPGICGLVAQLGRVEPRFQQALDVAAGGRLGYLVVEDDRVAAGGIDLLKQRRAGRATFLPLNGIRVPKFTPLPAWQRPDGFIDYAVNLIECEPRYQRVFAYVFGSTAVFETLDAARPHLGQFRMVTLEGEILETSGAMTGGSLLKRQGSLHFGTVEPAESEEAKGLRQRLQEIEQVLMRCDRTIEELSQTVAQTSQTLMAARQRHRDHQLERSQADRQQQQLNQRRDQAQHQLSQAQQELTATEARLQQLAQTLPAQEQSLQAERQALAALEQSQTHSEWQQAQTEIRALETDLDQRQAALRTAEQRLQELTSQSQRLEESILQQQQQLAAHQRQQTEQEQQRGTLTEQQAAMQQTIDGIRQGLAALDKTLATEKANRDRSEYQLRERQTAKQQQEWQRQKLQESQQERRQRLAEGQDTLAAQAAELPDPQPEIPAEVDLDKVRQELRSLQRRLEALEPVNMLALDEYHRTQERLDELSAKLTTLEEERTELLLRIENFTTLRRQAFQEAFTAVNQNFQAIFAQLSDGDGHLQLDDPQDPFNGGLNLVAHPKGKPVRRLASMSGGEKSLTALSFIFALQRYRPSPFYAFDEVDMFLDGANVERLSRMIKQQAEQAQFIVVSLRRPMIEASQRTIGVTQARGAYTQVLGLDLQAQSASM